MRDVSIVIVSYNTKELVDNCIQSILQKTENISFEIVVVDNNSTDGTVEFLSEKYLHKIKIISNKRNCGFGIANNVGVRKSTGKYILLLNSDTILTNNAVKFFFDYFETTKDSSLGCIGTFLKDGEGNVAISGEKFPNGKRIIRDIIFSRFLGCKRSVDLINSNVDFIIGADIFVKREVFMSVGGFDERFFLNFEETDLQYQLAKRGYRHILIEGPGIIHLEGQSYAHSNFKRIAYLQGMLHYMEKKYTPFRYLVFKIVLFMVKIPSLANIRYSFRENLSILGTVVNHRKEII